MSREEEKCKAAESYEQTTATNLATMYGWGESDIQQQCFKSGVEWADEHPREGLWDAEKVIEWLENHVREFKYYDSDFADGDIDVDGLIETLTKSMEE